MKERKRLRRKKRRKGLSKKESLYGILLAVVIVSILFIYFSFRSPSNQTSKTFQLKAAIVDHLSFLQQTNPTFIEKATTIMEEAGFTVDYYPGENVTVEFYEKLPTYGYGLIVLRVHSAVTPYTNYLNLFTSEPYSETEHRHEQAFDYVMPVAISEEDAEKGLIYFGIHSSFVKYKMTERFENTTIIMMGCDGLKFPHDMAKAFVKKGAKAYISWSAGVLTSHTDKATTQLLRHLVTEKQTIKQAVNETMDEVGPDPVDGSILQYYPTTPEAENYVIPEPETNLTTNVAEINSEIVKFKKIVSSNFLNRY